MQDMNKKNIPYIITTDSHAATKNDLYYQGRHVQIAHDNETLSEVYEGCYLQSEEEIHEIMDKQIGKEAVEIGLLRTNEVSDLIDDVRIYTSNDNSEDKENWKKLSNTDTDITEAEVYVSEGYKIYHELDAQGLISGKYLMSKEKFGGTSFK